MSTGFILLIYNILCYTVGFSLLPVLLLLYTQRRDKKFLNYLILMLPFAFTSIGYIVEELRNESIVSLPLPFSFALFFSLLLIIALPWFVLQFRNRFSVKKIIPFIGITVLLYIALLVPLPVSAKTIVIYTGAVIEAIVILVSVFVLLFSTGRQYFLFAPVKKISLLAAISILFFAVLLFDLLAVIPLNPGLDRKLQFYPLFYALFSVVTYIHVKIMLPPPTESFLSPETVKEFSLTAREVVVIRELATGKTYKEVAAALFVSENTIRTHIRNIYSKTDVSNKVELLSLLKSS